MRLGEHHRFIFRVLAILLLYVLHEPVVAMPDTVLGVDLQEGKVGDPDVYIFDGEVGPLYRHGYRQNARQLRVRGPSKLGFCA